MARKPRSQLRKKGTTSQLVGVVDSTTSTTASTSSSTASADAKATTTTSGRRQKKMNNNNRRTTRKTKRRNGQQQHDDDDYYDDDDDMVAVDFLPDEYTISDSITTFSTNFVDQMDELGVDDDFDETDHILAHGRKGGIGGFVDDDDDDDGVAYTRYCRLRDTLAMFVDMQREKRTTRRESILRRSFRVITQFANNPFCWDVVEKYAMDVRNLCIKSLRSGTPSEQYAACRVLEATCIVLFGTGCINDNSTAAGGGGLNAGGGGFDHHDDDDDNNVDDDDVGWCSILLNGRHLRRVINMTSRAIPVRAAALRAVTMCVFMMYTSSSTSTTTTTSGIGIIISTMKLCKHIASSSSSDQQQHNSNNNNNVPMSLLRSTALDCWAVLATLLDNQQISQSQVVVTSCCSNSSEKAVHYNHHRRGKKKKKKTKERDDTSNEDDNYDDDDDDKYDDDVDDESDDDDDDISSSSITATTNAGHGVALLPFLLRCLETSSSSSNVELRSAAGECIALIHESRLNLGLQLEQQQQIQIQKQKNGGEDDDDDGTNNFDASTTTTTTTTPCYVKDNITTRKYVRGSWEYTQHENIMDQIQHRISELAIESSHHMSKKAKKEQRATFREFSSTIIDNDPPYEVIHVVQQKRNYGSTTTTTLTFKSWRKIIQINFIRHCLQGGFQTQLVTNPTLRHLFCTTTTGNNTTMGHNKRGDNNNNNNNNNDDRCDHNNNNTVGVEVAITSSCMMTKIDKRLHTYSKTSETSKLNDIHMTRQRKKRENIKNHFLFNDD